jgi:beta-glucosidase/6-phospho-beta-glucosidase/beta-galactosidase
MVDSDSSFASNPFLWGVSTSGYQSEGGYNQADSPHNNWANWEARNRVMRTGKAVEFWSRYDEDFQRCQTMGLNAFRLSIEWARVQPTFKIGVDAAPEFDEEVLNAYGDRLASCRQRGLEPIVTLHHFTHPAWLGVDAWLSIDTIDAYITYVQTAVTHINRRLIDYHQLSPIRWYITINEPNILVSNTYLKGDFPRSSWGIQAGLRAYNHLLSAHVRAYNCIHDLYDAEGWSRPNVSLNTYCSDLYWSEKVIWDLLSLNQRQIKPAEFNTYISNQARQFLSSLQQTKFRFQRNLPYRLGQFLGWIAKNVGDRVFTAQNFACLLDELAHSPRSVIFDFVAIDYYDPFFAHTVRLPSFSDFEFEAHDFRSWLMSSITSKWWDWRHLAEGLYFFCQHYAQDFQRPVLIAENGMALRRKPDNSIAVSRRDRLRRSDFLRAHVEQVHRLRQAGVPLVGYMHWSLTDNYEWGSYTPRFGLFTIDFTRGSDRLIDDHLSDRPSATYARLIQEIENYQREPQEK